VAEINYKITQWCVDFLAVCCLTVQSGEPVVERYIKL
jgi:hypothetical protein